MVEEKREEAVRCRGLRGGHADRLWAGLEDRSRSHRSYGSKIDTKLGPPNDQQIETTKLEENHSGLVLLRAVSWRNP